MHITTFSINSGTAMNFNEEFVSITVSIIIIIIIIIIIGIYYRASLTAKMPIIKPAQKETQIQEQHK
jgi:uncharacterized alpha/beta hydrolase family protein